MCVPNYESLLSPTAARCRDPDARDGDRRRLITAAAPVQPCPWGRSPPLAIRCRSLFPHHGGILAPVGSRRRMEVVGMRGVRLTAIAAFPYDVIVGRLEPKPRSRRAP